MSELRSATAVAPKSPDPGASLPHGKAPSVKNGTSSPDQYIPPEPVLELVVARKEFLDQILADFSHLPPDLLGFAARAYEFRGPDSVREEGLIGAVALRRALTRFTILHISEQDDFLTLLWTFPYYEESSAIPHALLLKELACREYDTVAFGGFAEAMTKVPPEELLVLTELIDTHHQLNTDTRDHYGFTESAPEHNRATHTLWRQNDAGKQTFRMTCFPSVLLLYRGEIDPLFSWEVRKQGFFGPPEKNLWVAEQIRMLDESGMPVRPWSLNKFLIQEAGIVGILDELVIHGEIDLAKEAELLTAVSAYFPTMQTLEKSVAARLMAIGPVEQGPLPGSARYLQEQLRLMNSGTLFPLTDFSRIWWQFLPYEDAIFRILETRGYNLEMGWNLEWFFDPGQYRFNGMRASAVFTPFNTADDFEVGGEMPLGPNRRDIIETLASGQDLILSFNGHVTLLSDVRETENGLEVFRSDTETGISQWESFAELSNSAVIHYPVR